jgi:hypothetical protein
MPIPPSVTDNELFRLFDKLIRAPFRSCTALSDWQSIFPVAFFCEPGVWDWVSGSGYAFNDHPGSIWHRSHYVLDGTASLHAVGPRGLGCQSLI